MSVADNLRVASWLHRRDKEAVAAGVDRVQTLFPVLKARADERASNLSGGQQQMLALGMALLGKPKLLMIDELSLGLAPSVVGQLMQFVDHLRDEGTTLVVVEQSVNVALAIADRAVFLERGEVRFSGPAKDLLARPDLLRSVFLSSASVMSREAAELAHGTTPAPRPANGEPAWAPPAPPAEPVLETAGLTVAFGGIRAVDDVSLSIAPGEIVGVIGPNGAGKTTLFDLISGFVPPTGGRMFLRGRDVTRLRAAARARRGLGRSFQDARLFASLTVEQTIAAALERWVQVGDPLSAAFSLPNAYDSEAKVRRRVNELIDLLGLQPYRSLFISELSTGTRRVVDLACLLAHRPSVVLLDEPASGIAQREVEALAPLIRRIRDEMGASVVLVEHDIPLVEEVADRMVAMDRGRVIAVGTPAEVLADPGVVSSYLGDNAAAVNRSDKTGSASGRESVRATEQ
jgi:branched-chain amino acid transport system ATP-binding protein